MIRPLALLAGVTVVLTAGVSAQQPPPLKQLRFDIVGVRLVVDPPALTVPKNIPTFINATLVTPPEAGAAANEALASLSSGAVVEAELRGPSIPPTRIAVPVGSPIPIPALALPGDYFLDGIRLVKDGQTVLDATTVDGRPATLIPIKVISEVFVTSVTSRPLTLDEIREKGIVIDSSSFQAVNFQAAFNIDGQPFTIELPAVLPTAELLQTTSDRTAIIRQVTEINQALAATQTTLPPEFDRPGINFSIAALPFFFVPDDESNIPPLDVPPINGLVVIAGNVAFLNQFFKVSVLVANVTPADSQLLLRDVTGTIALPTGLDRIAGTTEAPGDDPLRLARVEGVGAAGTVPVLLTGPDGVLGTADDQTVIPPQKQGEGELLLEGLKEGGHTFDVNIEAFLDGLPSGPVRLVGLSAGAVFVRNPTFSVTLAHPRTIRSGESYDLYATVTNTSRSIANLVSVNLDPLSISGAQLLSEPTVTFETIASGQSATAKFTLRAQQTGEVTFSSFTGEAAAGGGIRLFTGIGERSVPLSPNAIVLPTTTGTLPAALVAAAQRVLGQAFSIATAPAEALPPDVLFVKRQTVIDRGLDLGLAGERVQLGEPLARAVQDLLLDWLGGSAFDAGFDQLMRTTEAGAEFLQAVAAVLGPQAAAVGPLTLQQGFAEIGASRETAHVSMIVDAPGTSVANITVTRADATSAAMGAPRTTTMPGAAAFALGAASAGDGVAVLSQVSLARHVFELTAATAGDHDLGIVIPGGAPGVLRQLRYTGVALGMGGIARVEIDLAAPGDPLLRIDANGDGTFETTAAAQSQLITEPAPQVLAVRQLQSSFRAAIGDIRDPATYGLILGVLLNKPVTAATAQVKTNYGIDNNEVIGAALQPSGRLVYLYLQKPVGPFTPRSLRVSDLADLRGQSLGSVSVPIVMTQTDGGHVFGQVREAGGNPVPNAVLRLTIVFGVDKSFDVATIRTDANGSFDFDFVPRLGQYFVLTAQHPVTRDLTSLSARLRGSGEQLLLNPTFTGRGSVRGRLLAVDGVTPVPDVPVALIPGAVLGLRGFTTTTNASGEFQFTDVPVGIFTLSAADAAGGFARSPGLLPSAGQTVVQDLVLIAQPESAGFVSGRVFHADGATPGAGFTVYVGAYNRNTASIAALDSVTADDNGSFTFTRALPPGGYDVVAVDPATRQVGTTKATVSAGLTTSVSIVLESTGAVEGVVFNAQGVPVPGAVIAGGLSLGTADANGFFRITGVPAGSRTIQAGDPVTKRRGSANVTVVPGQTVRASITLEARATITGRVLDANGQPMPRVSVRLPQSGGFTFVFTNNQGVYTFPDMPLGSYLIQAPGPSVDSLIEFMANNGIDPQSAFTSGDAPGGLGDPPPSSSDKNAVLAAYQEAVQRFFSVDESLLGLPMASVGGFGWTKVQLFQDSTTVVADLKFLSQGQVGGQTEDSNGRPTAAVVRILGLSVSLAGQPIISELGRMTSDAATGRFQFGAIPRFDLATFQTAGVRGGDFTLDAAQPFSPSILTYRDQLNTANPDLTTIVLRFPSATETNGTVSGQVLLPDGVTPAGAGVQVAIGFGDLTVQTGADGRFQSLLPIPAGTYTVAATAPNGLRGQALARIPAGGNADIQVRLLGLGNVSIVVRRPNGVPVVNALVRLERATFPGDRADGRTDATGTVQFVNLSEGPVGVIAEEEGTGLTGRASGVVARNAAVAIPLTITASGRVTGRFLSADGSEGVPFAQITISSGGIQAFTSTDSDGRFEALAIPVGRFTVEGHDPLTGRLGRASDELLFEGQTVDVTLLQLPRGTVAGLVLNADAATAVAAARVSLSSNGIIQTSLQATARTDGSFRFDGIPEGVFTIEATDPVSGFRGTGSGRITFEGELVDLVITLEPFGALRVAVEDVQGQPMANATVAIAGPASRSAAVDATGRFTFEHLPLGTYSIVARSLANSGDGGSATAVIESGNQLVDAVVRMRGTGSVTVRVVEANGTTPVVSARVVASASGRLGTDPPGPVSGDFEGFTDAGGNVTFQNVPIGDFFARAEAAALAGVATGSLPAPGATASVTVQLGASGTVSGRVLLPDGLTPAAQAIVTLRFQSQSQLQSGVLQVTTGIGGTFSFAGIPLGTFTVSAFELVSSGVRTATGSLSTNGQTAALGDLVLDNAGPRVLSIDPGDGSSGVAPNAPITIRFSEAIDPASVRLGGPDANIVLLTGGSTIGLGAPVFSEGNQVLTLQPALLLASDAQYVVSLRGAPDGIADAASFPMGDPVTSTFRVRDTVAPTILSIAPANDAVAVLPESVIRIAFSEPVASGTLTLRTSTGSAVPGTQAFSSAGTVLVFSPQDFLQPNASYTITLTGVADGAGNSLAPATVQTRFFTVDTIAPLIAALQIAGNLRSGSTISIQPVIGASDMARVEFRTSQGLALVASSAPFGITLTLPATSSTTISAVAVDVVGNRSSPFEQLIQIQENTPPAVTLTTAGGASQVAHGQTLTFQVRAVDDGDLAQVLFSAVGAATTSAVQPVAVGQSDVTLPFTLTVPQTAPSGGIITVQAAAVDAGGLQSPPVSAVLTVLDGIRPVLTVLGPINNSVVVPGQTVEVVVDVADDVAIASVGLSCAPSAAGCETRPLSPGPATTRQTFRVVVPEGLQAPQTLTLSLFGNDTSGNAGTAIRVLQIADITKPSIGGLQPVSGSTQVVAGSPVSIRAAVSDNVGVTGLVFSTDGAVVTSGTAAVTPPVTSGPAVFGFMVPAQAANGAVISVTVRARDAAGNLSDPATLALTVGDGAPPTIEFVEPAAGTTVNPGSTLTVRVRAADDTAVARVTLTSTGVLVIAQSRDITPAATPADVTFQVEVPAGTPAGQITLAAQAIDAAGGTSQAVQRPVIVNDAVAPAVSITTPAAGAALDPRGPITVTVQATDAVGVTQVSFAASGAASASETRVVAPPVTSRTESFTLSVNPLPVAGGTVTLTAAARDAAGNLGTAAVVQVSLTDVVAPDVLSTLPATGATAVDPGSAVKITFTEPMDPASLTGATIQLRRGSEVIATSLTVSATGTEVTLTPAAPLPLNALVTIVVATGVRDANANNLAAERIVTFTTASPDTTPPRVSATNPANGASGVSLVAPVAVTFSESIDPASLTGTSFRVLAAGVPLAGTRTLENNNAQVRFTPVSPYPAGTAVTVELTSAIVDPFGNPLAASDGTPLQAPLTFAFTTSPFSITSPPGTSVVENRALLLEARASAASGIVSVVFTVNGQALPAVTAPFSRTIDVGSAASTPALVIIASGRDGAGVEIARDERTVSVVVGITVAPTLTGVPVGGTSRLRFSLSSPLATDLPITLEAGDPALVGFTVNPVVLMAGQTFVDAEIRGLATGATAVIGRSDRGTAAAIVASSPLTPGMTIETSPVSAGVAASRAAYGGYAVLPGGTTVSRQIQLLHVPASVETTVSVVSLNSSVASATIGPVSAGSTSATLQITGLADGIATLLIRVGDHVRAIEVFVGTPAPDATLLLAPIAGTALSNAAFAGQVVVGIAGTTNITIPVLTMPSVGTTGVAVSSLNPSVATGSAGAISSGATAATITVSGVSAGTTTLLVRAGGQVRAITVTVGTPAPGAEPLTVSRPVGLSLAAIPTAGRFFVPVTASRTIGITLFTNPVSSDTPVTVTSSNPSVVAVTSPAIVAAGGRVAELQLTTGESGIAILTLEGGGLRRQIAVSVGTAPTPETTPPIVAAPVGISVIPNPSIGRLFATPGVVSSSTIGFPLLASPAGAPVQVSVRTSNSAVVLVGGAASTTATISAGEQVASILVGLTGTEGAALLTIEFNGERRELLVVVGNPPASEIPAVTAPIVGVKVGG